MLDIIEAAQAAQPEEGIMHLKDDRWVMKVVDESTVVMFACRVNKKAMEEYRKEGWDKIGVRFPKVKDSIYSSSENVEMEVVDHKLHVRQQGYDAGLGMVNPEYVAGNVQSAPDLEWPVEATGDISFIKDFVKRSDKIVGGSSFIISPRKNHLYLYSERDDQKLVKKYPWDDFDSVSINWELGDDPPGSGGVYPGEQKACDTVLSIEFAKALKFIEDEGTLHIGNHVPLKLLFDTMEGVDASYFFSPRISTEDTRSTTPNDSVEPEDKLE